MKTKGNWKGDFWAVLTGAMMFLGSGVWVGPASFFGGLILLLNKPNKLGWMLFGWILLIGGLIVSYSYWRVLTSQKIGFGFWKKQGYLVGLVMMAGSVVGFFLRTSLVLTIALFVAGLALIIVWMVLVYGAALFNSAVAEDQIGEK